MEEFEKVGFAYVMIQRMKCAAEVGVSHVRKPISIEGTYWYKVCECFILPLYFTLKTIYLALFGVIIFSTASPVWLYS